jgi:N6-adenosine-specific RNA methylase IME4
MVDHDPRSNGVRLSFHPLASKRRDEIIKLAGKLAWFRGRHEHLLLGTRGNPRAPLPADRSPSLIIERRTTHSTKPDAAYRMIERMFPGHRKLELFGRPPARPGWWAVGLDTTADAAAFRTELQNMNRDTGLRRDRAADARTIEELP